MQPSLKFLEKITDFATKVAGRVQQSWRLIAIGAVLIVALSVGLLAFALSPKSTRSSAEAASESFQQGTSSSGFARLLDGVIVADASSTALLPIAVMVENSADAWPLSGPAKANLVIEAPVEGSITRFMLVFDASATTTEIGPVRSARPYYVQIADGLGAFYAHVGGSPEALTLVASLDRVTDYNEFSHGWSFWRSSSRAAPHNVFTSMEELNAGASSSRAIPQPFSSWTYTDDASVTGTRSEAEIEVPYQGLYRASWAYDEATRMYTRTQGNAIQRDTDGTIVRARNVVLMESPVAVLDEVGRLSVGTKGSGRAAIFHDGQIFEGVWRRSEGEHLRFETVEGRVIPFARGNTWISILSEE
jgi:hypothetical protein